jgi:hypothetical protein
MIEHPLEQKIRKAKTVHPTKLEMQLANAYLTRQKSERAKTCSAIEALKQASKLRK